MQRPYIAGPMTGYAHHNFPAFFAAEEKLRRFGMDPINPARNTGDTWEEASMNAQLLPEPWEYYMRLDLQHVLDSDGIVLLRGWEKSKGACLEVVTCIALDLPVCQLTDNHAELVLELYSVNKEKTYATAMSHLVACGLHQRPQVPEKT